MLSRFFIDRPIFANVIAIVTMIMGGVAVFGLPIEQYPDVTPPPLSAFMTAIADAFAATRLAAAGCRLWAEPGRALVEAVHHHSTHVVKR